MPATQTQSAGSAAPGSASPIPEASVHITLLLDRSGSMESIRDDVVGGFNAFLAEQQAQLGACKLTMVQFDSQGYDYLHVAQDIADVKPMTRQDFQPRGGTPLYDSVGRGVQEAEIRAKGRPGEVQLFVILTDGEENSSKTFTRQQIFEMIETKQGKGWVITYLGANQDAYKAGYGIGVGAGNVQNFAATQGGTAALFSSVSMNTRGMRSAVAGGQSVDASNFYAYAGKGGETYMQTQEPDLTPPPTDNDDKSDINEP